MIEKTIKSVKLYNGKIIKVKRDEVLLPNGNIAMREIVEHNGGSAVLALTDNHEIILVKQFRYPYGEELYEIPAGKLDLREEPELCAARELREETGMIAGQMSYLGEIYPTPGYCNEVLRLYLATDLSAGENALDDDELLTAHKIPIETAVEMVKNNEIRDSKTVIAVLRAASGLF